MRKRGLILLGAVGLVGLALLLLLDRYKTDMIHLTILNAVVQKAPLDYPVERIQVRFQEVFQSSRREGRLDVYLKRLLALAQRLEKIQHLDTAEVDELLATLDQEPPSRSPDNS